MPLQIGARDVAFPRMNAFGFWAFLSGGLFLYLSPFLGGAPDGGWFAYAPNTGPLFSPTHGIDFWALALLITGIASLTGAINLIVTILNMRAPGMTLMKMPIFTWMILVVQFLLLFAIPVITVALFLLLFRAAVRRHVLQRHARAPTRCCGSTCSGSSATRRCTSSSCRPSASCPRCCRCSRRKPLFGYPFVVFSGVAIGFMGWGVWAHHMFASGLGPDLGGGVLGSPRCSSPCPPA